MKIRSMQEFDFYNKNVLLRLDINSPIDKTTKRIVNETRFDMSLSTLNYLLDNGAKVAIIAHQGDTLDYQNLIPLNEHAEILSKKTGKQISYIDDVAGPFAIETVKSLTSGSAVILGNLRYLTEEVSAFEKAVKLTPTDMLDTYLVRRLAPIFDAYVNDAFASAHRNSPSMVAFQEILPSFSGNLLSQEVTALSTLMESPQRPCVFVLGGLKIADALSMMKKLLSDDTADKFLTCGVTGLIMLAAKGIDLGHSTMQFIKDRALDSFIKPAKDFVKQYPFKIICPLDLAYNIHDHRMEIDSEDLPVNELLLDVGTRTVEVYSNIIKNAGTIFVNGPAGVYENPLFEKGTKAIWDAVAHSQAYSVIGGGDTVTAAAKFLDIKKINYICSAGGAMVKFLSGEELPLIEAMKKSYTKYSST